MIFIIYGLDLGLTDAGLFHLEGFLMAPSYISIFKYILNSLAGNILLDMFIGMTIYMVASITGRYVYSYVITGIILTLVYMLKNFTWITPFNLLKPVDYLQI